MKVQEKRERPWHAITRSARTATSQTENRTTPPDGTGKYRHGCGHRLNTHLRDIPMETTTVNFGPPEFMPVEEQQTWEQLGRIVGQFRAHPMLDEDLMQEALIHWWQIQERHPGQTRSWYLQNCRFHLQHHLASGRSVDSLKRRNLQVHDSSEGDDEGNSWENLAGPDSVMADVSARDMLFALVKWLSDRERMILHFLVEGMGVREIARQLDVSHPTVIKSRRKIAGLAKALSISPLPSKRNSRRSTSERSTSA